MDANDVIAIIKRRQAKFEVQRSSGREDTDETTLLVAYEYDALLAEIDLASANEPAAERKSVEAQTGSRAKTIQQMKAK